MNGRCLLAIIGPLLLLSPTAKAQIYPPGTFSLGGVPVGCGPAVFTEVVPALHDAAIAVPAMPGLPPRIILNASVIGPLPPPIQMFVYAHECFHHTGMNEQAADCFAVRMGRDAGVITPDVLAGLCQMVWLSPGDWTHFPGQLRCQQLQACYFSP